MNLERNLLNMRFFQLLFLFVFTISQAQNGEKVYSFLNVTTSARQAALGGNVNSTWDADANCALWNPAMMNEKMDDKIGLNYISYLSGIKFGTASWVHQIDEKNYVSVHGRYFDYGTFDKFNEFGINEGTFNAKDVAVTLGYAFNISDFFTIGTNFTYINSQIETYQSNGVAVDLGLVFHDIDYDRNLSFVVRNLGRQIKAYDQKIEKLPLQINLGYSQKFEGFPILFTATLHDLQQFNISSPNNQQGQPTNLPRKIMDHVSLGGELFPDKGFNIRLGYNFKRGNELAVEDVRSFSGLTYGFGIKIKSFRFDYAHANFVKGSGTNHFGMQIDLESLLGKRYSWE